MPNLKKWLYISYLDRHTYTWSILNMSKLKYGSELMKVWLLNSDENLVEKVEIDHYISSVKVSQNVSTKLLAKFSWFMIEIIVNDLKRRNF